MGDYLGVERSGKAIFNNKISKEMFDYIHLYNEVTNDDLGDILDEGIRLHSRGFVLKTMPGKLKCTEDLNVLISKEMRAHIDTFCDSLGLKKGRLADYALRLHRQEYGSKIKI
jgi:hypothetical protein